MSDIIIKTSRCDINHKSVHGSDALNIACKLGDLNAVYLLLHWGADPNSFDNSGDTSIHWLLRHRSGHLTNEVIRILLKFGADPSIKSTLDGDSPLHIVANDKKVDLSIAFALIEGGRATNAMMQVNKKGLTPYMETVHGSNRRVARLFMDSMLYHDLPYWTPTILVFLLVNICFVFLYWTQSILYSSLYFGILYFLAFLTLLQHQVQDHRSRIDVGMSIGLTICLIYHIINNISPNLNGYFQLIGISLILLYLYTLHQFRTTKPKITKPEPRMDLAQKIIDSSPLEGPTDEELEQYCNTRMTIGPDAYQPKVEDKVPSKGPRPKVTFVRDPISGKLVKSYLPNPTTTLASTSEDQIKKDRSPESSKAAAAATVSSSRSIGPRICATCLCDKRSIYNVNDRSETVTASSSSSKQTSKEPIDAKNDQDVVISISTHCYFCGFCVEDVDHHSPFLGNCVGRGNRRLFVILMALGCLLCLLYFLFAKWLQYSIYCSNTTTGSMHHIWSSEWCLIKNHPGFGLTILISGFLTLNFLNTFLLQLKLITMNVTLDNAMKRRHLKPAKLDDALSRLMEFIHTGNYHVSYHYANTATTTAPTSTATPSTRKQLDHRYAGFEDENDLESSRLLVDENVDRLRNIDGNERDRHDDGDESEKEEYEYDEYDMEFVKTVNNVQNRDEEHQCTDHHHHHHQKNRKGSKNSRKQQDASQSNSIVASVTSQISASDRS